MRAEIISIGDELLIGQTINTNASWMGQQLSSMGIRVVQVTTISDDEELIRVALDQALSRAELIFVTGGLGPTKDDITKYTLASYFNTDLVMHEPTRERIEAFFKSRNRPMLEVNIKQAELPRNCTILPNDCGTAAGMWFDHEGKVIISMPGVPYEMKGIMEHYALPKIKEQFNLKAMYHRTLLTQGIGESFLADELTDWENRLRASGLSLAYLPSPGMVKLRITSFEGESRKDELEAYFEEVIARFPKHVFGRENDTLSEVVGNLLLEQHATVGTVESCTGGAIAQALVQTPGSSAYFQGGYLTYSYALKQQLVQVDARTLESYGAVSQEVVEQMALNGRKNLGVDYCVAASGIAGPDGGMEGKPVGTVWIAVAHPNGVVAKRFQFGDNRGRNIQMSVLTALNLLRCQLVSC